MGDPYSGFGIYIHWPFCSAKCPYCDFNSHVRAETDQVLWCDALLSDLRQQARTVDPRPVSSIFFGGGTPSLMDPSTVSALIDEICKVWGTTPDVEISLEANPTSVEAWKFQAFKAAGINRVSLGIQALNDADLKALGRMHTVKEATSAFDVARNCFDRVSFDLIYARQHQSLKDWELELKQATNMAVDHMSLYQLTVEDGTRFGELYKRKMLRGLPTENLGADMYDLTNDVCTTEGYPAYEVSNHCRSGSECRHNLIYWRYEPYLGIGPGAHGRPLSNGDRKQTVAYSNPERWIQQVRTNGHGLRVDELVSAHDAGLEYALMSLRLSEGLDRERYQQMSASTLDSSRLDDLIEGGFLCQNGGFIAATAKGKKVLNRVLQELLI